MWIFHFGLDQKMRIEDLGSLKIPRNPKSRNREPNDLKNALALFVLPIPILIRFLNLGCELRGHDLVLLRFMGRRWPLEHDIRILDIVD